jgi:hypothetical protein
MPMTDTHEKDSWKKFFCPFSAGMEFEVALGEAESLFNEKDFERSLELLRRLERQYVQAARVFDLIGDVLLRQNHLEEGVRYKTFHEVLTGTLRAALGEDRLSDQDLGAVTAEPVPEARIPMVTVPEVSTEPETTKPLAEEPERHFGIPYQTAESGPETIKETPPRVGRRESAREDDLKGPGQGLYPVTAAMGLEFMRQGHFDRAAELFDELVRKHPEDESLREARDRARNRGREKKVVERLNGWLGNVKLMKLSQPSES